MSCVVDSSVVMAFLKDEPGWEIAANYLENSYISAVNYAEVRSKLMEYPHLLDEDFFDTLNIVSYHETDAQATAWLYPQTKSCGLSLGDRACLALGVKMKLPVVTADKVWKGLDINHEIICIR